MLLGLRGSPLARRTPSSSGPTPSATKDTADAANPPPMATPPAVDDGNLPEAEMSNLTVLREPRLDPIPVTKVNGVTNGIASHGESHHESHHETHNKSRVTHSSETKSTTTKTKTESRTTFSSHEQITILRDTVIYTRGKFISEFDYVDEDYIDSMTIENFLDFIERQRLTHMPHRGSRWDKVLKWAEFFGLQIAGYAKAVGPFVESSKGAAKLALAASCVLLRLGPSNAQALETTFGVLYKLGLSLSFFLRHQALLSVNGHIRMEVGHAFNALLMLVREVSIYYHVRISGISSSPVTIDFNSIFGGYVEDFYRRKNHIIDDMWEHELGSGFSVDVRTIRKWLGPRDRTIQTILDDRLSAKGHRDEYSCEWFQRYLLDFSRSGKDDILAVTAGAGCGKSVLSGWVVERLQRPLGRKTHQTLSYVVEADIPSKTASLEIAKNLSLQLLENNVGDKALYKALVHAHNTPHNLKEAEKALWDALNIGLKSITEKDNLMIIIDGLDEVKGGKESATAIGAHLHSLTSAHRNAQAVVFSQEYVLSSGKAKVQKLPITPDHTHNDLNHMTDHYLRNYVHFKDLEEHHREAIVGKVARAAKGNFLWAILTSTFLKQEASSDAFQKAVEDLASKPLSLSQTIEKIKVDFSKADTNLILSWLLVAERPLTIAEVRSLLEVDVGKGTHVERHGDIKEEVIGACGMLVVIQNGFVRLRHSAIREHLLKVRDEKKKLVSAENAQADLTTRLLAYCKFFLTKAYEPVFERMDMVDVDELFHKHFLLEYAVRNWTLHFRHSKMYKGANSFAFEGHFKSLFPSSTHLAVIEWTCWGSQSSSHEAIGMHELALRIRQDIFTEKHESVLQNLIVCGSLYRDLSKVTEAGMCFYRATHIGESILRKHSTITITCATTFVSVTESITVTKRTEVVSRKEEMLKYIIMACQHTYGKTSDIVIRYYKVLAQLYIDIHEESHAEEIWKQLREIIIQRHGKGSEEETYISEQITIVLKRGEKQEDIIEYEKGIFETTMEMDIWDVRRIKIELELAVSYESRREIFMAEELYILLWGRLIEHCHHHRHHHGVEIHISMIDIAVEYVRFLRRHHRHEEACSILICIWTEYEEYTFESETIFLRLKIIGEIMKAISLLSIAVSVFRKCLGWFKSHGKHEHTESCEVLISETMEEIITSTSTTTVSTTTSTTTTTSTETVIKETFESTMSRTTVTHETITVCKSMLSFYMNLEQWSEAIKITERSLSLIWKMIISGGGTCALPVEFGSDAIDIAIQLAICHHRMHHFFEAEEIYLRIYRACRNSCHIHDERLTRSYTILIKFYEEHRHWHKLISIYQEMLVEYRRHLGASHALTIKILYHLGSLCGEHGHGHAIEYYEEIVRIINGGSHVCHHDSREAMIVLCRIYYEQGHWHKLKDICAILWETWVHHHHEHKFETSFIEVLYMRYRYVLEHHFHCEYEDLRSITIEFRSTSVTVFGAFVGITIRALTEYAQLCMRSEKYIHEAISTYEEVLTKTTTTTTTTSTTTTVISSSTTTTIKESLSKAYVSVCSHGSVSTTIIERAIKLHVERLEYLKLTFGCHHMETLIVLRELVLLYKKLKTQEAHAIVVHMLLSTTIEIITKQKHSKLLFEVAKVLGGIYLSFDLVEYGREMILEMRRQVITGHVTSGNKFGFKFDKSIGRASYVFIVTFEEILRGSMTISYSQIMADLLIETILYESYTRCLKSETSFEVILTTSARLRAFWVKHKRTVQVKELEHHIFGIFIKKWGSYIKTSNEIKMIFFLCLLDELKETRQTIQIGDIACSAGSHRVGQLLKDRKYQEAYDVALCVFQFTSHHRAYHHLTNVGHGFKLSAYMAGRGLDHPLDKTVDATLRQKMLDLSIEIIRAVLTACKDSNIKFIRMQLRELNDLVGLLGAQHNYADLEWLLNLLWSTRNEHKNWKPETIIGIGKRLVQARFLGGQRSQAIRLCEDICYNLRRVHGSLHPLTLEMSQLLSDCYTVEGHYREAMGVHEEILRLVVEGDDDDDRTIDTMTPDMARKHLDELKRSYQRLSGWDKSPSVYEDIVQRVIAMKEYKGNPHFTGVQPATKWNMNEKPAKPEHLSAPTEWEFADRNLIGEKGELSTPSTPTTPKRPGTAHRATSNWGMRLIHGHLFGKHDDDDVPALPSKGQDGDRFGTGAEAFGSTYPKKSPLPGDPHGGNAFGSPYPKSRKEEGKANYNGLTL